MTSTQGRVVSSSVSRAPSTDMGSPERSARAQAGRGFVVTLRILLGMILTLMALGAGVRVMGAGLSCPDWPLCFGKVIPDFHPGVWFEFVHRAYAGVVALTFFGCCVHLWRKKTNAPRTAKRAAIFGLVVLLAQILMGGLTVLWLVKAVVVTTHLVLATLFFCAVLCILFVMDPALTREHSDGWAPLWVRISGGFFSMAIFAQIIIGGLVASTYAGSVCVDWPLCNGQWVPTWSGAIGLQIIHRFVAYGLAAGLSAWGVWLQTKRSAAWMTTPLLFWSRIAVAIVLIQVGIGVANLLLYIPAWLAVIHQTVAILLLAASLRISHLMNLTPLTRV